MAPNVTYEIRVAERLVMHTVAPGYTADCIIRSFQDRIENPAFEPGMAVVWRVLPGARPVKFGENSMLLTVARWAAAAGVPYRVALVGEDEAVYGSLRQYVGLAPASAAIHNVFHDLQSALEWVQLPIEPKP
jgi:hypothetical protein